MIENIKKILREVNSYSDDTFSGLGLIVYKEIENIPILPLRNDSPNTTKLPLINNLINISSHKSTYHDGFHLLSENLNLTHVSQYFSPPIAYDLNINYSRKFGGRYLAALFGSKIDDVLLTGTVSRGFGLSIFKDGKEVFFEEIK